jgi:hypothetical protein
MANVQTSSDVGRRERDVEEAFWFRLPIWESLGFEETLSLPPVIPGRLNSYGIITAGHWLGKV